MTDTADREALAEEHAHRLLDQIEAGRREATRAYIAGMDRTDLAWLVLALANGLAVQEAACDSMRARLAQAQRENQTLDTANIKLFAERRTLTERVAELREINSTQAGRIAELRQQVKAAA